MLRYNVCAHVWQHGYYCLHSQVDLCLYCVNICTLMTLYGSKVHVTSLIQHSYWKIHCLRLPEFNVYTNKDVRPPPPSQKKSVLPWVECYDHHLTNYLNEHACV